METVAAVFAFGILGGFFIWALVAEVKHMKMCTAKAKEEMEFFRSFRAYLEALEAVSDLH